MEGTAETSKPNAHLYRKIEVLETKIELIEREIKVLIDILFSIIKNLK